MNEDYDQEARMDGKTARRAGDPRSANPHHANSEARSWDFGWDNMDRRLNEASAANVAAKQASEFFNSFQ
jgi:hypothetical protein